MQVFLFPCHVLDDKGIGCTGVKYRVVNIQNIEYMPSGSKELVKIAGIKDVKHLDISAENLVGSV